MPSKIVIILGTLLSAIPFTSVANEWSTIDVFKSPTCGCCSAWIEHLKENGFSVQSHNVDNLIQYKEQAALPHGLGSCHTAFVGEYAVEGHVPASDIKRVLTEKLDIRGLAVPGMPMGSPGMEYGDHKDSYQTISYTHDGKVAVFAHH